MLALLHRHQCCGAASSLAPPIRPRRAQSRADLRRVWRSNASASRWWAFGCPCRPCRPGCETIVATSDCIVQKLPPLPLGWLIWITSTSTTCCNTPTTISRANQSTLWRASYSSACAVVSCLPVVAAPFVAATVGANAATSTSSPAPAPAPSSVAPPPAAAHTQRSAMPRDLIEVVTKATWTIIALDERCECTDRRGTSTSKLHPVATITLIQRHATWRPSSRDRCNTSIADSLVHRCWKQSHFVHDTCEQVPTESVLGGGSLSYTSREFASVASEGVPWGGLLPPAPSVHRLTARLSTTRGS